MPLPKSYKTDSNWKVQSNEAKVQRKTHPGFRKTRADKGKKRY